MAFDEKTYLPIQFLLILLLYPRLDAQSQVKWIFITEIELIELQIFNYMKKYFKP